MILSASRDKDCAISKRKGRVACPTEVIFSQTDFGRMVFKNQCPLGVKSQNAKPPSAGRTTPDKRPASLHCLTWYVNSGSVYELSSSNLSGNPSSKSSKEIKNCLYPSLTASIVNKISRMQSLFKRMLFPTFFSYIVSQKQSKDKLNKVG